MVAFSGEKSREVIPARPSVTLSAATTTVEEDETAFVVLAKAVIYRRKLSQACQVCYLSRLGGPVRRSGSVYEIVSPSHATEVLAFSVAAMAEAETGATSTLLTLVLLASTEARREVLAVEGKTTI